MDYLKMNAEIEQLERLENYRNQYGA
jgi:hypothetical protein